MAKFIRKDENGTKVLKRIEFSAQEMASKVLEVDVEDLLAWKESIPPYRGAGEKATYAVTAKEELEVLKKRAMILRARTSPAALKQIEKAGLLNAYAGLAIDCPEGIPVHVWRSYGLIVLMQARYGRMIGPEELAERANLRSVDEEGSPKADVELAEKHLRLLIAMGYLSEKDGRWEHQGLPQSWRGAE